MTIHVNIGEAQARLSELVAAALRGEEVLVAEAGARQVRLVPVAGRQELTEQERDEIVRSRMSAVGMWKDLLTEEQSIVPPSMTDEELEERWQRKFGPSA